MKTPENYYNLKTPRSYRRCLKRACRKMDIECCKCEIILRDEYGANIIKSRRLHGRILKTESL